MITEKVYIVVSSLEDAPIGVFSSAEKAADYVDTLPEQPIYSVLEYGVDVLQAKAGYFYVGIDYPSLVCKDVYALANIDRETIQFCSKNFVIVCVKADNSLEVQRIAKLKLDYVLACRWRFPRLRKGIVFGGGVYYPEYDLNTCECVKKYGSKFL